MNSIFNFNQAVIEESYNQPVIVEIASPGCGPCIWMEKTLLEVIRNYNGRVHFVSIPISDCKDCIDRYKIKSNPTTLFFVDGNNVARLNGALPKIVVEQWIDDQLKNCD